ncbi:MAG: hypothetical protein KDD25_02590, partial [Bdellovibrionales bacterium]|nr:hypothetical protein [Bdellovibrionales bacterium]
MAWIYSPVTILNRGKSLPQLSNGSTLIAGNLYGKALQSIRYQFPKLTRDFLHHDLIQWGEHFVNVHIPELVQRPTLRIPASTWKKQEDGEEQSQEEAKLIQKIYRKNMAVGRVANQCWGEPLDSVVVSQFASPRTLPNGKSY